MGIVFAILECLILFSKPQLPTLFLTRICILCLYICNFLAFDYEKQCYLRFENFRYKASKTTKLADMILIEEKKHQFATD